MSEDTGKTRRPFWKSRKIIYSIAIPVIILLVILVIALQPPKYEKLTSDESLQLSIYNARLAEGMLNDLDSAKEATEDIKKFVEQHKNMIYEDANDKKSTGADILWDTAESWRSLEESQDINPKNTADLYLLLKELYPNFKKNNEINRWLKVNSF